MLCGALIWQMNATHAIVIGLIAAVAALNWLVVRRPTKP
jgi:hypothetical protein